MDLPPISNELHQCMSRIVLPTQTLASKGQAKFTDLLSKNIPKVAWKKKWKICVISIYFEEREHDWQITLVKEV